MLFLILFLFAPEFEAEIGSETVIEELQRLKQHPININIAKEEGFIKIYWISPRLAKSIVKTRKKNKGFKSIKDLKEVPGMSDEIFDNIKPYITLKSKYKIKPISFELRSRFQETFPKENGNKLGNPVKSYQRVKLAYSNISGTLLLEKDPYEYSYTDFMTYGIMIKKLPGFSKIVIGDYRLEFGEGLLFGFPPLITFKTQGMIKGKEKGIRLYTITGENTFLRGVALESQIYEKIKNFTFFSDTKLDGKFEDGEVSIYYNYEGDYSTELRKVKKDRIREKLFGTRFEFKWRATKLGFTGYKNWYFLNPEGTEVEAHNLYGFDFTSFIFGLEWFSEIGKCDETLAAVAGIEYKKGKIRLGILSRYYPAHFYVLHSSPFSDRTTYINGISEKGNYVYMAYKCSKNTKFIGYTDVFTKLPKINSFELPIHKVEYFGELEHKFTSCFYITGRYKFESEGISEGKWLRLQADVKLKKINFRIRAEKVYETDTVKNYAGKLLYLDLGFNFSKSSVLTTRFILFNSGLHKFRLYEYERDLPGLMINQSISGEGTRLYLFLRHYIAPFCAFSLKYAINSKNNESKKQKWGLQFDLEV
ncbi:helix-hairpin-helix domain-containing protein [candidate division WOR-3 bacterium]|nr:helix-hairpin-helix domain-containing protein [candidate division WOR-3 bacterium]